MSLTEQLLLMKNELQEAEDHINKLQSGRKASSSKARASLMKLKKGSHQLRGDIIKFQKELPVKSRKKTEEPIDVQDARMSQADPEPEEQEPEPVEDKPKASSKKAKPRKPKKVLKE